MSVLDSGKRLFWHFLGDIWDLSNSNKKRFTCRAASTWPNSSSRGMESIMLTLNLPFAFPSSLPPESSLPSRGGRFPHTAVQELLAQADYSETLSFTWATLPLPHTKSQIQLGLVCLSSAEAAEARSAFFSRDFSHSTVFNLLFSFLNVNKIFLFILESGHAERARGWWPRQPPSHWSAHPHTHKHFLMTQSHVCIPKIAQFVKNTFLSYKYCTSQMFDQNWIKQAKLLGTDYIQDI